MQQAALIPELYVTDIKASRAFYTDLLGFDVRFERLNEGFCSIALGKAELMLEQFNDGPRCWKSAALELPLGRGVNFQIMVDDLSPILNNLPKLDVFLAPETKWYQVGDQLAGQKQVIISDPDGYLLRFAEDLGTRPAVS